MQNREECIWRICVRTSLLLLIYSFIVLHVNIVISFVYCETHNYESKSTYTESSSASLFCEYRNDFPFAMLVLL